ncbi:MAG: hypothetical protein GY757_62545 [bacterium]|nr:hypothetical protein [bacterium]
MAFITSMEHLLELFPKTGNASNWKMSPKYLAQFAHDPQIKTFKFKHETTRWW